jgi:glutaredoxin
MARRSRRLAVAVGTLAGVIATSAVAQSRQVYRYVDPDGRVVYSDQLPPANARDVEAKRLSPNLIEIDQASLAAQRAQDRFPVTLYTYPCGDVCERAEALLNRRGVPFTTVNVNEAQGAEQLKKLTGELQVPVLQAGDKLVARGFSDSQWQTLLDDAGYPKAPPLRRPLPAAEALKGPPSQPVPPPAPAAEPASGGYPRN